MKRKTSVTLSEELVEELDRVAGPSDSRSAYIERVLRSHFRRRARAARDEQDVERINAGAGALNAEMDAILGLQAPWPDDE
jgi:metal-responsive CopG/Arc/MetJ family transcriptional regulator